MINCLAVFKSKTDVFAFLDILKSNGIYCVINQTPKEARIGCGISVKFSAVSLNKAVQLLRQSKLKSFFGIFEVYKSGNRTSVRQIV